MQGVRSGSLAALLAFALAACGDDQGDTGGSGASGGAGGSGGNLEVGCDPIAPSYCGFPYPNDYWTSDDDTTVTGLRLALPVAIMPANTAGVRSSVAAFNEADGFSPGIAAMTHMPGATIEGLADPGSIDASLETDSPTVIIDAETGERVAHWAELDEYVVQAKLRAEEGLTRPGFDVSRDVSALRQEQALMLRPAIRLEDATRYIVAIRNVVDENGVVLEPSPGFAAFRDGALADDAALETRRARFDDIFERLERAGVGRNDLQIAWDFTTASRDNNTAWMVHIRDDAFSEDKFAAGVPYTVEAIEEGVELGIACRLEIVFDMPLYMTGGEAGELLRFGDDGLPEQNGTFPYAAAMVVPEAAQLVAAPLVEFGHGQLGAKEQVLGFQEIAVETNFAVFALDFKGFAADDQATIASVIAVGDFSQFRAIPERMHQGFLNFLMAMRTLSIEADGPATNALNEALDQECGGARLDGTRRYYFGGSQGGILGATLMALSQDIERGLLAVPGQPYNLLLNRSVNFDQFAPLLYGLYDWNALDLQIILALIQGLWDRAEPTGYSKYIRTDTLPNTPSHEVLIQVSKSDHQVTNLGAHLMARTIGGVVNLAPTIRQVWGITERGGPNHGSSMIEVDFGNEDPPIFNVPPWGDPMDDPHSRATELSALGETLLEFYQTGTARNPCDGPCDLNDLNP